MIDIPLIRILPTVLQTNINKYLSRYRHTIMIWKYCLYNVCCGLLIGNITQKVITLVYYYDMILKSMNKLNTGKTMLMRDEFQIKSLMEHLYCMNVIQLCLLVWLNIAFHYSRATRKGSRAPPSNVVEPQFVHC